MRDYAVVLKTSLSYMSGKLLKNKKQYLAFVTCIGISGG